MRSPGREFRDRLVNMEQVTPALREKYRKGIQAIFEKELTGFGRLAWIATGIGGIGFLAVFGTAAVLVPGEFPLIGRLMFVAGAAFGLAWAVLSALIVKRGSYHRISHSRAAAGLGWSVAIVCATGALLLSNEYPDSIVGVKMICVSLVFLVPAAMFMLRSRIQESELRTREKLLDIELRLAELAEKLEDSGGEQGRGGG